MQDSDALPRHVAIIMDGNGRWAQKRNKPRTMGHQAGPRALRKVVRLCVQRGIESLTVFAFSSENWNRPRVEVSRLMDLFVRALDKEVAELHENGVRVRFIGEREAFRAEIRSKMDRAEALTRDNRRMTLNVAANYGGRWDIVQASRRLAEEVAAGRIEPGEIDEQRFAAELATGGFPDPDLFIRTGGEMRISNFLLWQSAYTEFYFSPALWPDFDEAELDRALSAYAARERRFGRTGDQLRKARRA
jgi:undecaprenyl diphosphate synthase